MPSLNRSDFGHDTATDEALEGIDLAGKTVLITGGSSGLGAETARALAARGAKVILTARKTEKGEAVASSIRDSTGNQNVSVASVELGSLKDIRRFAEEFLAEYEELHLLINNAGVMASPYQKTEDGFELQFGTNHLGHFLLTNLLTPALVRAAQNGSGARIVNLSSRGHQLSAVVLEDVMFEDRDYEKWSAYGQSKTANILFTVELDRRLRDQGIRSFAVHPGVIMTDLARHMSQADFDMMRKSAEENGSELRMKSVEAGAATTVYAATAPELEGEGGVYLEDCGIAAVENESREFGVRSYALDAVAAEKLWKMSEDWVNQEFPR